MGLFCASETLSITLQCLIHRDVDSCDIYFFIGTMHTLLSCLEVGLHFTHNLKTLTFLGPLTFTLSGQVIGRYPRENNPGLVIGRYPRANKPSIPATLLVAFELKIYK